MAQQPQTQISLRHTQTMVKTALDQRKKQLASILSSEPRAERLIMSGMIAVAEMRDAQMCDPVSIARAITQAAMLGIDLTAGLGEGFLIKYGNQCTLSPGYRCWQRAAQSAGYDVVFDVVREGDTFDFCQLPPTTTHAPKLDKQGDIIGAYAAVMGGVDAVVFTAGIGERSALVRQRVGERLGLLGATLDPERNRSADVSHAGPVAEISGPVSRTRLLVVATDEEHAIARRAARLLAG